MNKKEITEFTILKDVGILVGTLMRCLNVDWLSPMSMNVGFLNRRPCPVIHNTGGRCRRMPPFFFAP
ncbi:MAG: hypothetical protein SCH71_01005 [Desulfobulbaceae bacterium]|nr:hypothetical protein [Desulfobulbaceae bacterium]